LIPTPNCTEAKKGGTYKDKQ